MIPRFLLSDRFPVVKEACCIYAIYNQVTDKMYIGSSINVYNRFRRHRAELRTGKHRNQHLQRSYDKHGERAFSFVITARPKREDLLLEEDRSIVSLWPTGRLYNLKMKTKGRPGDTFTEETKRKISETNKRVWRERPELIEAARLRSTGRKQTPESTAKTVAAHVLPYSFRHRDGRIAVGINRAKFCRENGLNTGHLNDVHQGRRKHCKGWELYKPE